MKRHFDNRVKTRVALISAAVFVIIAALSFAVFSAAMRRFNRENAENRLNNVLKTLELGFARSVNSDLTLALKMADTPAIRNFFRDPSDEDLEAVALEEFASFESHFENHLVFWVNDVDKMFHSTGAGAYAVDPSLPENYWYNMTMYETARYNFNINWNPDIQAINLWVNIPVRDADGKPLGILGTGIDLREFIKIMSGIGKSFDSAVETYIFNAEGEIVVAEDYETVALKAHVDNRLGVDVLGVALEHSGEPYMFAEDGTLYCVYAIPELGWYAAGSMSVSAFRSDESMINYLFIILLAAILVIVVVFNVLVRRYTDYITLQAGNLVESQKKEFEAKNDAEAAALEKEAFIGGMTRRVREAANEIVGTLNLVSLRGGVPNDVRRLIADASSAGRSLLHAFEGEAQRSEVIEGGSFTTGDAPVKSRNSSGGTHHFFVINPKSFVYGDELKNFLVSVEKCFSVGHREEYKTYISRYPRDAQAAIHRYISSVPSDETVRVYAVGGDGIAFDCVNGLAGFPNAEIVTIPYGNANDICRSFGAEHFNEFRDIKLMSRSKSRPMDAIQCGRALSVASCSIGIEGIAVLRFTKIIELLNDGKWRFFVPFFYKLGGVLSIIDGSAAAPEYRVTIDGKEIKGRFTLINVGNIALNGGSNTPNPPAMPNDGLIDVIMSTNLTRLQALRAVPVYTSGRYTEMPGLFNHRTCRSFTCESDSQMCVVLDGETFFTNKISLEVVPNAIKIVSPGGIGFKDYSGKGGAALSGKRARGGKTS